MEDGGKTRRPVSSGCGEGNCISGSEGLCGDSSAPLGAVPDVPDGGKYIGWSTIATHRTMEILSFSILLLVVDDNSLACCARFDGTRLAEDISTLQVRVSGKSASTTEYRGEGEEPPANDEEEWIMLSTCRPRI
jgi:hypothetical protein